MANSKENNNTVDVDRIFTRRIASAKILFSGGEGLTETFAYVQDTFKNIFRYRPRFVGLDTETQMARQTELTIQWY
jgi:hypothetical protein